MVFGKTMSSSRVAKQFQRMGLLQVHFCICNSPIFVLATCDKVNASILADFGDFTSVGGDVLDAPLFNTNNIMSV